jgi:phage-related protein
MSDIVKGIGNLFASLFEIITGVIGTAINAVTSTISAVIDVFIGIITNLFNIAEGVAGLILGKSSHCIGFETKAD